jgi:hypothetical protein
MFLDRAHHLVHDRPPFTIGSMFRSQGRMGAASSGVVVPMGHVLWKRLSTLDRTPSDSGDRRWTLRCSGETLFAAD